MIYLCYLLFGLLVIRCVVAIVNLLSFAYVSDDVILMEDRSVSVLIPARNEEKGIQSLLENVLKFDYHNFEVIVYNDNSTDGTQKIVEHFIDENPSRVKLLNGGVLPKNWLGKNYACHQLARAAKGDVLLFLDADVKVGTRLIQRSVSHLDKNNLHLLSIFPKQVAISLGEKISVPLMNWILLSLLPLFLIRNSKNKAFSAANGQFMMFKTATYMKISPHERVKSNSVEDIAIVRLFKENNLSCDTRLGDNDISCRMYDGLDDAIEGFTKSIFTFFGNSILVTVIFGILITIAPFVVYFNLGLKWLSIYLTGIILTRFFVSLASKQSVVQNILLMFPQHIAFLSIISKGLINKKKKKLIWKGRNIFQE